MLKHKKRTISQLTQANIGFEDVSHKISISEADKQSLIDFIFQSIQNRSYYDDVFPSHLEKDDLPRILFISISDSKKKAEVFMATGNGWKQTVKNALKNIFNRLNDKYQMKWLKLDLVHSVECIKNVTPKTKLAYDHSLYGLAFDRSIGLAFLPEQCVAETLINRHQLLRLQKIAKFCSDTKGKKALLQKTQFTLYSFSLISLFKAKKKFSPLFRGHRMYSKILLDDLLNHAIEAGQYLMDAVEQNGRFAYEYLPKKDQVSSRYNILRHCGTIYAMMELYEFTQDMRLLTATKRAIRYLIDCLAELKLPKETVLCVVEDGYAKLGGNALAILALTKYMTVTKDMCYLPEVKKIAAWIKYTQNKAGEFYIQKQRHEDGEIVNFQSEYYPGEAIFALCRLYQMDSQEEWLTVADKAAKYLITVRDKGLSIKQLIHDHWLLYGLNELYRLQPDPIYIEHTQRLCEAIMEKQVQKANPRDHRGSFYKQPRSTPTAIRAEGLSAGYHLVKEFVDERKAGEILESIERCITFQLQTQFHPESAMYLPNPQRTLGGFKKSLTDYSIRIDYVQHNISALLGLYKILGALK